MKITEEPNEVSVTDLADKILQGPDYQFEYTVQPTKKFPQYKGKFILKYPTVGDEIMANRLQAHLRGFVSPAAFDIYQNAIFDAVAWLKVVVIGAPQWFVDVKTSEATPEKVADMELLMVIYQEWLKWRNSFRGPSSEEDGGDKT